MCTGSEAARQECASADGCSVVNECLRSSDVAVQSAAAKAMQVRFYCVYIRSLRERLRHGVCMCVRVCFRVLV